MTFEEQVYQYGLARGIPTYYLFPDEPENREVARELRAAGRKVFMLPSLQRIGLARVPTVLRVGDQGVILSKWTGTVPTDRSVEVLESVTQGRGLQSYSRIDPKQVPDLAKAGKIQVLAFSKLSYDSVIPVNIIPAGQVYVRAKREMNPSVPTVIVCDSTSNPATCQEAALALAAARFEKVVIAGLPNHWASCP
jgi:hypothetical protein